MALDASAKNLPNRGRQKPRLPVTPDIRSAPSLTISAILLPDRGMIQLRNSVMLKRSRPPEIFGGTVKFSDAA